jgi:cysteine-rich repeat protein
VADAGAADRTSTDLDPGDLGPFDHDPDAGSADLSAPDTAAPDLLTPDSARPDGESLDAAVPDSATPDTLIPDSATPDTLIPDSATPDTLIPDSAMPDTADASVFCADGTVYAGHCYVHPAATGANWREAFDYCQARGMHLVQVESDTERDFILSGLGPFHTNYIWIGLHDMTDEDSFTLMDGTAPTWTDWVNASEPNDRDNHGEGEDCVVMTANTGGWYDYTCRVPTASSDIVCELDPTAPPAICGDGVQGPGEACDDQNTSDGDECNAVCTVSCVGGVTWDLHCYQAGARRDTWLGGGASCGGLGLVYASIGSPEEQQAMNDLRTSGDLPQEDLWIGLSDMLATGWLWSSGEETLGYYVGWGSGEPDGTGQCVVVGMHGAETTLWWHDADCASASHMPLCESE